MGLQLKKDGQANDGRRLMVQRPRTTNGMRLLSDQQPFFDGTAGQRLALPLTDEMLFVKPDEIIYLKAEGSYTHLHLLNEEKLFVTKRLKDYAAVLTMPCFFKPHRSFIINLNHVRRYVKKDGGFLLMDNGDSVTLARDNRERFCDLYR